MSNAVDIKCAVEKLKEEVHSLGTFEWNYSDRKILKTEIDRECRVKMLSEIMADAKSYWKEKI